MMIYLIDKMKYNQYHTVETVPKPHRKIKGDSKSIQLTHKYVTAHVPGLVQAL